MAFTPAICTQCGAKITVDDTKDAGICEHCGTAFVTEKVINNYTTNVNNTYNVQNATFTTQQSFRKIHICFYNLHLSGSNSAFGIFVDGTRRGPTYSEDNTGKDGFVELLVDGNVHDFKIIYNGYNSDGAVVNYETAFWEIPNGSDDLWLIISGNGRVNVSNSKSEMVSQFEKVKSYANKDTLLNRISSLGSTTIVFLGITLLGLLLLYLGRYQLRSWFLIGEICRILEAPVFWLTVLVAGVTLVLAVILLSLWIKYKKM